MIDCKGKVAVVVGGTRGIGRAATIALAQAGAHVAPVGRSAQGIKEVSDVVRSQGAKADGYALDIRDESAVRDAMDDVCAQQGRIDVVVANAGINPYFVHAEDATREMWDEVLEVNLLGLFASIQAAGRHMLALGSGSVVVVSSVTASKGTLRGLPYVASKGALNAMVRTMAIEWASRGVRVNAVAPGYIETDLTEGLRANASLSQSILDGIPIGRYGRPDEIAPLIVYLSSDASSYVTGQIMYVDGGMSAA